MYHIGRLDVKKKKKKREEEIKVHCREVMSLSKKTQLQPAKRCSFKNHYKL